ncbi:uncharacterized protein CC84DRAFT_1264113 [Paraphaeosphaeria sporulosa]|uniref:1-alkyl-2-acetylglycerophosphocholine esterase n=1 Tax=Paraphaeosphaeria sporulosa TaxID=1460663 RepID=A0A177BZ76_9PLEO|nr:uncharacterized protein CC84DRAFT_1264113 [Paraphaeosphaeria sporulosa]OAF99746.1 hypothetical protein CC84DRAFT_1264113 [Paraphaeosphaeria sporulosa]
MLTTQLIDYAHNAPFAPSKDIPRVLGLSIFYPTATNTTVATSYWPPENAAEESEGDITAGVNITYQGLLSLTVPLAPPNTSIAAPPVNAWFSSWPVLFFSPAFGETRFLYTSLLRQISSIGYVVITFETAYDTSVFVLANGTVVPGNSTLDNVSAEQATLSATARTEDASFILDHAHDNITWLIPGCKDTCVNTTNVGMFGHSIGGAASATAMFTDSRIIGGLNYDGALLGPVVQKGLSHRPFLIFGTQNQSRHNTGPLTTLTNWTTVWPRIKEAPKWWLLLNHSRHYTFSDLPLIAQKLGVKPNQTSLVAAQLTDADAERNEKVLVTYTAAFFKSVFTGKVEELMKGKSNKWPEVIFDSFSLNEKSRKGVNETDVQPVDNGAREQKARARGMALGMGLLALVISTYI